MNTLHRAALATAAVVLCAASANAQKQELTFWFMGAEAGKNVYEARPDGSFVSETDISLAGTRITSKMTGLRKDGALVEYTVEQAMGPATVKIVARGGKATLETSEKGGPPNTPRDYKPSKAYFANFHPVLSASLADAYTSPASGSQKLDLFLVDGAMTLPVDLIGKPARAIEAQGRRVSARAYQVRFPNVDMDLYVTDDGRVVAWNVPAQYIKAVAPGWEALVVDPTTKMPELSQPTLKAGPVTTAKIKMRDGVELAHDACMPAEEGKYPVVLIRTPYGRKAQMTGADWWAKRGYVSVVQDVRGRGESAGDWEPFVHERSDGYDTLDWISKQPWCNGSVGMIGGSYVGWVQWWAAVECHPVLKCIVPQVSPPDPFYNFPTDHGIPFLYGGVWWAVVVKDKGELKELPKIEKLDGLRELPITKVDDIVLGQDVPFINRWWEKQTPSEFGTANFMADLKKVRIPALHISGWWDGDGIGTKLNWAAMRKLGRDNQWLIYGPWTHAFNSTSRLGDTDYGPEAILELDSVYLRWFDTWLKGKQVGLDKMPRARVFVTGENKWVDLDDWPASKSVERRFYLAGDGPANHRNSAGKLVEVKPPAGQEPDRYTYNPAVTTIPKDLGSMDVSAASTEIKFQPDDQDQLVFKTEPLAEPIVMTGPVDIELYISSSAPDTDFHASVVDVDETGKMRAIGRSGKIRAKYHRSFDKPELLKPGKVYRLTLAHWDVAHRFAKGHRIGLLIGSNGFPIYARNLGTGEPDAVATRMVAQSNAVYHDAKRASVLKFRSIDLP
jgi:putative CocE/NonD family hydrolase